MILDVDQPAVRAILALFTELKNAEGADCGWNGGDTVDTVSRWLERIGIDPNRSADRLEARFARDELEAIGLDGRARQG